MLGFDSYQIYKSFLMKDKIDIIKYNFKTKISKESFLKNPDKYKFMMLEKKYTRNDILSYFWYIDKYHHGMIYKTPIVKSVLDKFLDYKSSKIITDVIIPELSMYDKNSFNEIGVLWPKGLELYISNKISIETLCFTEIYNKNRSILNNFSPEDFDFVFKQHMKKIQFDKFFIALILANIYNKQKTVLVTN